MSKTSRKPIRKAVFPVAGLGTRFLPATKAMPKEMLTVVDRPVIQHVVDEARRAGIAHCIFVTGRNKATIEDHFDRQPELEEALKRANKQTEIDILAEALPGSGTTSFTRQQAPLGLGHAVWCARDLVGDEPFALLLPDMIVQSRGNGCLAELMAAYDAHGGNIVAVEEVDPDEARKFGIVAIGEGKAPVWPITAMVEKPAAGTAPSNLYIMGRYLLQPEIFDVLAKQAPGAGGEIQLTDAMRVLQQSQPFWALRHSGRTFDCGSTLGFLTANVALGLERPGLSGELRDALKKLM